MHISIIIHILFPLVVSIIRHYKVCVQYIPLVTIFTAHTGIHEVPCPH